MVPLTQNLKRKKQNSQKQSAEVVTRGQKDTSISKFWGSNTWYGDYS